jgi:hypothetical protein
MDAENERRVLLLADVHDAVEHGPVADVEGWYGEVVFIRDVQDRLASRQHAAVLLLVGNGFRP